MNDADLLDLLEILEDVTHGLYLEAKPGSTTEQTMQLAERKISSFRTAIRQRMLEKLGEV